MAVVVFSKASGQVSSFIDPTLPARTTLRIQNWGGFLGFKSIISRVTITSRGNFQFLHTLGGQVFVYVFGDRIGQLGISGLSFDSICGDPAGTLGIERVLNYYSAHRIAARQTPVKVSIGTATTLSAYLIGITGDVVDPKSRIWQFNMELALIPVDDEDEDSGTSTLTGSSDEEDSVGSVATSPGDFPTMEGGNVLDTGGATLQPHISTPVTMTSGISAAGSGPNLEMIKPVVT